MVLEEFQKEVLSIQEKLYHYGVILTSNKEEARDLVQETTLKAFENKDKFIDNTNIKGWLYTIMRNIFINDYRKNLRCQTIIDQTEDLYYLNLPQKTGIDTPEGSYTVKEINEAIKGFDDDYRMPFTMHVAGYKYHEIADKLDLPLGTVKSRIHFTRQRLQEILKDYRY